MGLGPGGDVESLGHLKPVCGVSVPVSILDDVKHDPTFIGVAQPFCHDHKFRGPGEWPAQLRQLSFAPLCLEAQLRRLSGGSWNSWDRALTSEGILRAGAWTGIT